MIEKTPALSWHADSIWPSHISRNKLWSKIDLSRHVLLQQGIGAPFDACHRPVVMQVKQSTANTKRCYVSRLVNGIEIHNSVLCTWARAIGNQACWAGSWSAGHCATFNKLNEETAIFPELYVTPALRNIRACKLLLRQAGEHQSDSLMYIAR